MADLTERQRQVLEFIRRHHAQHGFWPSIREVQAHFRFKSTNAVVGHLHALEAKGMIARSPGQARAFRAVNAPNKRASAGHELVELPVYGSIAAGYPVAVDGAAEVDRVRVDRASVSRAGGGGRAFALRVRGESMIDAGIQDGDTVLVDPRPPRDGEVVVALIDGQSTLKRFTQPRNAAPYLRSENRAFPEMHPVSELVIQGVATAIVRKL